MFPKMRIENDFIIIPDDVKKAGNNDDDDVKDMKVKRVIYLGGRTRI